MLIKPHASEQDPNIPWTYSLAPTNQGVRYLSVTGETFGILHFDHKSLIFGIEMDYNTEEKPRLVRKSTEETWKNFRKELMQRKLLDGTEIRALFYFHFGYDNPCDCVDEYLIKEIEEAYELSTPEILVKPPPPEGYLSQWTVKMIEKSKKDWKKLKKQLDISRSKSRSKRNG